VKLEDPKIPRLYHCTDVPTSDLSLAPPLLRSSRRAGNQIVVRDLPHPQISKEWNHKSNQLLSEQDHPGLVFLKARSELDHLLLLSVSAAPSASGTDEGAGKCIEIFAISLTV
jgi:hypothetical protein